MLNRIVWGCIVHNDAAFLKIENEFKQKNFGLIKQIATVTIGFTVTAAIVVYKGWYLSFANAYNFIP